VSRKTSSGVRELRSNSFDVRKRLCHRDNALAAQYPQRTGPAGRDEDFRRNWHVESWSVGVDGAFVADRADDQAGATLRRIFNTANSPLFEVDDFRFVARITIVTGCDAQLQFRITSDERWRSPCRPVTLAAARMARAQELFACTARDHLPADRSVRSALRRVAQEYFDKYQFEADPVLLDEARRPARRRCRRSWPSRSRAPRRGTSGHGAAPRASRGRTPASPWRTAGSAR
jgi:hypothetical protein